MNSGKICVPLMAATNDGLIKSIKQCEADAGNIDIIELRLDYLKEKPELEHLTSTGIKPLIITCRTAREGGKWNSDEETRLAILQKAINLNVAYIDIEADAVHKIKRTGNTKIIASHHDFNETPNNILQKAREIEKTNCDVVKFATMANSLEDNLIIFETIKSLSKNSIGICMGELGEASRILNLRFGSLLTFGSLEKGMESAPGQLSANDLACLYRVREITDDTKIFAVAGNPIAHSMSPEIHNAAFKHLDIDAVYFKLKVEDFEQFINNFAEALDISGLSVTIPHKQSALNACSIVNDLARQIGSVNTMTRTANGWRGDNTDCEAATAAIINAANRKGIPHDNRKALLLGAGGTARAIGFGLTEKGCNLTIANRTRARAEELASELDAKVIDLEECANNEFNIVANTTSVGMHPKTYFSPLGAAALHESMAVFDAVYNPPLTKLLLTAKEKGAEIATGIEMFVGQAARQFEIWTGQSAPIEIMEQIVLHRLGIE